MDIRIYKEFPPQAMRVRQAVFVEEQGFVDEFDDIDALATHLVLFGENNEPLATCRVFRDRGSDTFILGRLCVLKQSRGHHLGSRLVSAAEREVLAQGGRSLALHSQLHATGFYEKIGYAAYGDVEDEQGCPHVWMKKIL